MSNNLVQTISLKDNGYSSGVKSAKQALQELGRQNGVVNNSFQNTSKELNSAKKFYSQLRTEYERLSDEAKKGEFGQAMHRQIEQTKTDLQSLYEQTARTKKELQDMQEQANKKVGGGKGGFLSGGLGQLKNLGGGLKMSAGSAAAGALGVVAAAGVEELIRATKLTMEYESALSNLKAITGVAGKDFDTFKEKIEATGFATSKSFEEVTDAYTKVGSAMPELLKTPDALDAVTRAAITLSKASRMDLDSAINSLTGIMNQFGANASQANRYINALAAGAKEGSAGIQYLATAMDKCGTSLATTNLGIEQGTALIEVLAKKIPDASTAGTNLRNILLKMSQAQDKFNPKVVGMEQALKNLQPKIKDTTFMVKMFGSENVNAAITLAQNVDKYTELSQKVTGTNEAFKQAGTQTDNLQSAMKRLSTNWDNYIVSINKSTGPLMKAVNLLAKMVEYVAYLNRSRGLGSDAIDEISKKYGGTTDYQEKATRKEQKDAYNQRMKALKDEFNLRFKQMKAYEKGMNDASRGKAVQAQQRTLYTANKLVVNALYKEIEKSRQSGKEYFYGVNNATTTTETTTTTDTTKKTKTKSPKEIYDEKVADIEAKLANGYIKEKQAIEEKIAAIRQYIVALDNLKKKTKQDEQVLTSLKAQEKALEKSLIKATDEEIVSDALENYNDTIKKLDRQRQNGWIMESEYQSQYISAIKSLCKAYDKVTDMSDKLIKEISEKQKEIKDFELQQAESKAATEYLTTFRKAERIYNGGKVARQAPANNLHEAHESAYIQLRTKADHAPEKVLEPGYTPTKEDAKKNEDWFRDYQGFLKENKHLLGEMYVNINNITDAVKHAKKLDLVDTIETEHYKKDEKGNFIKDAQGKLVEDVPYETLIDKYKKDLESVGWKFNFDEEDFKKKVEELGAGTSIPIHFELKPSFETVDTLAEIAENWKQDDEVYRQIMKFHADYKKDLEEFKHYVDTWQFPDKLKTRGDASNFSNRNNISYNRLSEKANTFYHGKGRLNQNLVDESKLQEKQEQLDKYLAKYKDIETEYTKMKEIAEKNGLDFKDSVDVKVEADLNDLEKRIVTLHDQIQDRLTFELRINGALDAVDALGGISNLGTELASIPDTLDSIEESSNDAAAAFQYFGLIINTVQGIIEGIQLVMTVYKGLTDAFTASETAKSIATKADTASQAEYAGVAEANIPAKAGETAANKALEASALDLAAANIFLAHSYIPFAGPILAAGLTTGMMGTMTGVHATALSLTAMANGGIVGDGTFSGDQTLIRANKGEMILNTQQQANLFSLLDGVVGTNQGGGKVKFEISGDNLVGVLNNHNRMKAKVGNRLR